MVDISLATNVRLYAIGRGFSSSYEIIRPSAGDWGERDQLYTVEPRLPYTALLAFRAILWNSNYHFFVLNPRLS
jgi:hypothetical protein